LNHAKKHVVRDARKGILSGPIMICPFERFILRTWIT